MPEETPQLPISEQEVQIEAPSFKDKLKLHKKKILIGLGLFFGVLALTGVILGAYLINQKQTQPSPQPTTTPEAPTPTPDPTADWETYTGSESGYSFKHPQTLTPSECKDGLHLFKASSGLEASEYCETPPFGEISIDYSTSPFVSGFAQSSDFEIEEEQITVGGTEAIKQIIEKVNEAPGSDFAIEVYFSSDDFHFLVTLRDEQYEDIFNFVLSTFEFLEEESCGEMSLAEAKEIALASECIEEGSLIDNSFCNEDTGTWWIDLDIDRQGCAPACVINVSTKEAVINWRCTGLIPD